MYLRWLPVAVLLGFSWSAVSAQEPVPGTPVVAQTKIGDKACGPCSVLNALKWGGRHERSAVKELPGGNDLDRVRELISNYGAVPSEVNKNRPRYREKGGMTYQELLAMTQDVLADAGLKPVTGAFFDRQENDAPKAHLRRVYDQLRTSLDAGFPPMVIIRSFAPGKPEKPKKDGDGFVWNGLYGHWVAVVGLPDELPEGAFGFTVQLADSWTGQVQEGYVYEEQFRNFTAAKGDDLKWEWPKTPRPFLLITLPGLSLGMADTPWYLRGHLTFNYGIFREE